MEPMPVSPPPDGDLQDVLSTYREQCAKLLASVNDTGGASLDVATVALAAANRDILANLLETSREPLKGAEGAALMEELAGADADLRRVLAQLTSEQQRRVAVLRLHSAQGNAWWWPSPRQHWTRLLVQGGVLATTGAFVAFALALAGNLASRMFSSSGEMGVGTLLAPAVITYLAGTGFRDAFGQLAKTLFGDRITLDMRGAVRSLSYSFCLFLLALTAWKEVPRRTAEWNLQQAQTAMLKDDYGTAAGKYQRVLELDPKSWQAALGLGNIQMRHGNYDGAVATFTSASGTDPTGLIGAHLAYALFFLKPAEKWRAYHIAIKNRQRLGTFKNSVDGVAARQNRKARYLTHLVLAGVSLDSCTNESLAVAWSEASEAARIAAAGSVWKPVGLSIVDAEPLGVEAHCLQAMVLEAQNAEKPPAHEKESDRRARLSVQEIRATQAKQAWVKGIECSFRPRTDFICPRSIERIAAMGKKLQVGVYKS